MTIDKQYMLDAIDREVDRITPVLDRVKDETIKDRLRGAITQLETLSAHVEDGVDIGANEYRLLCQVVVSKYEAEPKKLSSAKQLMQKVLALDPNSLVKAELDDFSAYAYIKLPPDLVTEFNSLSGDQAMLYSELENAYLEALQNDTVEEFIKDVEKANI